MKTKLILIVLLFTACSKDLTHTNQESSKLKIIPIDLALKVAERTTLDLLQGNIESASKLKQRVIPQKTIDNQIVIPDTFGNAAMYVFNYINNDGFVIISADERYAPICAFIDTGHFGIDTVPATFVTWFEATLENIEMVRYHSYENSTIARTAWIDLLDRSDLINYLVHMDPQPFGGDGNGLFPNGDCCPDCPNYPDCLDWPWSGCGAEVNCDPRDPDPCGNIQTLIVGPLMQTEWGQGCTYNELCPDKNCNNVCWSSENAWTGCVATAMSQVLKYWSHPNQFNYNYSIMPNFVGNVEVQKMMRDVGEEVDMDYGCSGSSASMYEADEAFTDAFDFSTSLYDGFNSYWLEQDLNAHRPAILDGCRTRTNRFLGWIYTYSNCHAWVCDGYWKTWNNCYAIESLLHMNWGWDGSFNGWYAYNNWNPGTRNYQYWHHFIHNLKP